MLFVGSYTVSIQYYDNPAGHNSANRNGSLTLPKTCACQNNFPRPLLHKDKLLHKTNCIL